MELRQDYTVYLTMRHLLLILMIALLPLRGWAADVMTVSMAVRQIHSNQIEEPAAKNLSKPTQTTARLGSVQMIDCDMVIDATAEKNSDLPNAVPSPLCKGCTTCQLCMALVTGYATALSAAPELPSAERQLHSKDFTSAERATGFKPPIS